MVFGLENRKIIEIDGLDAVKFLHSLSTNNIVTLELDKGIYNTILTPTSRFLCDFFVYKTSANILIIDIFEGFLNTFNELIKKYQLRSKFNIIEKKNFKIKVSTDNEMFLDSIFSLDDPRSNKLGKRYLINDETNNFLPNQIKYDDFLVENGICAGEWLETEKAFILEYNFENLNAIDFNKGCYIGQELITRTKRTGEIRKELKLVDNKYIDLNACKIIKKHSILDLYLVLTKKIS